MDAVKYKGTPLDLGDRTVIVPGLSLRQLRDNSKLVQECLDIEKKHGTAPPPEVLHEMVEPVAKLIHLALTRNYPNLALAEVEDSIDLTNMESFVNAVMGQSGMQLVREVPKAEGSRPGEA